ncbi:hypothetical protein LVD15_07725 [Fulvivirga maritima]|uniref:hypothetical protein n=1 Tax=Fulvivirga maritima TaxID=2904247 RepID=UPI001F289F26|nr:hypothetical protein [Fulvivirga maritima]UII28306.1 hypothetical protein LVD15_07725 [Fulvivirga maritima]
MIRLFYFLISVLLFSSCSYRIARNGYEADKSDYVNCYVKITRHILLDEASTQKLGEIELGETGLTVACNEEKAIEILRGEACSINANLVLITEEKGPDLLSSCYRCKAEFYRLEESELYLINDDTYDPQRIISRISENKSKNTAITLGSALIGFLIGFLVVVY